MLFHDLPGDRQPDTGALDLAGYVAAPTKAIKDARQIFVRNAEALVAHGHECHRVGLSG